jgi:hypothetical protein
VGIVSSSVGLATEESNDGANGEARSEKTTNAAKTAD